MVPQGIVLRNKFIIQNQQNNRNHGTRNPLFGKLLQRTKHADILQCMTWIHMSVVASGIHICTENRMFFFCCLFRLATKKTQKVWPVLLALSEGNPPVISGFPSQRASNAEWVSTSKRHHDYRVRPFILWQLIITRKRDFIICVQPRIQFLFVFMCGMSDIHIRIENKWYNQWK